MRDGEGNKMLGKSRTRVCALYVPSLSRPNRNFTSK
jgi:hypothetical protein